MLGYSDSWNTGEIIRVYNWLVMFTMYYSKDVRMLDQLKINSLDLKPKLIIAFVLVAILVAVTGAVGYTAVASVDEEAHVIAEDGEKMDAALQMIVAIDNQQQAVLAAQLGDTNAQQRFSEADATFTEEAQHMQEIHLSTEQQSQFAELQSQHQAYNALGTEYFEAREAGDDELAQQKLAEMESMGDEMEENAHAIEQSAQADLEKQVVAADTTTQNAQWSIVGLTVVAFGIAIAIGLFVANRITKPITQLSTAAVAASDGDLSVEVEDHVEADELGRMVDAFQEMQANQRGVFAELTTVSQGLETGNLEQDIETDYPGEYGKVIQRLESGRNQLRTSFDEIHQASNGLRDGEIDQTIVTDQPGQYGAILQNLDDGAQTLSESFAQISTASESLKTGALNRQFETDYPGEYGAVLTNLDMGISQLSESVETIQEIATETATSTEEVADSAEEIESASDEVASSVQEISHGTETQSDNLQTVADEMNDMSATVEEIASSAEEVTATAKTAVERSDTGQSYAAEATEEIRSIESQADEAARQVKALDKEMAEIEEIVEMITQIADQTNILALNASIEAARAGKAGEGFAVVANEIKSLAGEVADATTEIDRRITEIQSTTADTVDGMGTMSTRIDQGSETIEDAIEMFDEIANAVEQAESGIEEISYATDDQAASSEEVVTMIDEVASVSEETAAEAGTVSAATEEQTASLSEITDRVQRISQLSDSLEDQVSMFETRSGIGAARQTVDVNTRNLDSGPMTAAGNERDVPAQTDGGERPAHRRDSKK